MSQKPNFVDLKVSVIGKELIICALKTAINNRKFSLDDAKYIYDLLNGDTSDIKVILGINEIVQNELVQLTNWILFLKKSFGNVDNSMFITQCSYVTNKAFKLSHCIESLLNKNEKFVQNDNHVFQTLDKICETYEDGCLSILQSLSGINAQVVSKINERQNFDIISQNLMKELEEINLEKNKIETELQLLSKIIDPEYQHIVDQYLNAKKEIQLINNYLSIN